MQAVFPALSKQEVRPGPDVVIGLMGRASAARDTIVIFAPDPKMVLCRAQQTL